MGSGGKSTYATEGRVSAHVCTMRVGITVFVILVRIY